jgi:glutathione peroxidase
MTGSKPKWNFHKYLIKPRCEAQVIAYGSFTKPDDKALLKKIDEFLKQLNRNPITP